MPSLQSAVHPHLHFTTLQVLSASSFNRASSSATNVLTDLLSRYLDLLALTCSQYAQHAGRTSANLYDALAALEEVGVDVNELMDWSKTEAAEFDKLRESVPAADDHKEQLAALRGGFTKCSISTSMSLIMATYFPRKSARRNEKRSVRCNTPHI
jgi:histone H3/H4